MKIETKFSCGDVVYPIGQEATYEWIPCKSCNATGRITLADGESTQCPKCYGSKGHKEYITSKWQVMPTLTIGQVRYQFTHSKGIEGRERFDNYKAQSNIEESYMCEETGIGSGTLHRAENLFATEGEALSAATERNAAMVQEGRSDD